MGKKPHAPLHPDTHSIRKHGKRICSRQIPNGVKSSPFDQSFYELVCNLLEATAQRHQDRDGQRTTQYLARNVMLGRIGFENEARQADAAVTQEVLHADAAGRAKCLPVGEHLSNEVVACHSADCILGKPEEGAGFPHTFLIGERIVEVQRLEGVKVQDGNADGRWPPLYGLLQIPGVPGQAAGQRRDWLCAGWLQACLSWACPAAGRAGRPGGCGGQAGTARGLGG